MSSFIAKKPDTKTQMQETGAARTHRRQPSESSQVMDLGRRRIECSGERLWQFEDFDDLPFLESCNRCHFSRGRDYGIKPFIVNHLHSFDWKVCSVSFKLFHRKWPFQQSLKWP
jgi:hypothetical protein